MTYTQLWDAMTNAPSETAVIRDADQAVIPFDDRNKDYQEYKAWLDEGNTPTPATPPPPPPPPTQIGRQQWYRQASITGLISQDDALQGVGGQIPQSLDSYVANVPADQQYDVKMMLSGGTLFDRTEATCQAWITALGWDEPTTEQFWDAASQLT